MKKKILTAVIAIVAVCAIMAAGTIAYLTDESNNGIALVNTFVASDGLIDPVDEGDESTKDNGFFITETTGSSYSAMPNVPISKDARFTITGKTDVKSYAFLKVTDTLAEGLTWDIESSNWILLDVKCADAEGKEDKNSKIYVYKEIVDKDISATDDGAKIIKEDTVNVADDFALADDATDAGTLSFLGFLCQEASFEPAEATGTEAIAAAYKAAATDAFKTCFKAQVFVESK